MQGVTENEKTTSHPIRDFGMVFGTVYYLLGALCRAKNGCNFIPFGTSIRCFSLLGMRLVANIIWHLIESVDKSS